MLPKLVQRGQLAAALEAGVQGQHAAAAHGALQQQVAQILGEHAHGVQLGPVGQLAPRLPLQAGRIKRESESRAQPAEVVGVGWSGGTSSSSRAACMAGRSDSMRTRSTLARSPRLMARVRCGGILRSSFAVVEVVAEGLDASFVQPLFLQFFLAGLGGLRRRARREAAAGGTGAGGEAAGGGAGRRGVSGRDVVGLTERAVGTAGQAGHRLKGLVDEISRSNRS